MACDFLQFLREAATGPVPPEPIQPVSQRYRDRPRLCLAGQPRQSFGELLRLGVTNIQSHCLFKYVGIRIHIVSIWLAAADWWVSVAALS